MPLNEGESMSTKSQNHPSRAEAPSRATASFTLQWGLVPVKIRLFTAVEDTNPVKRSKYTTAGNKVIQPQLDSATMTPVTSDDVQYMVDYDGKLVELTDEEMATLTSDFDVDSGAVEITFVPLDTIGDRYPVEKWYQARPGRTQTTKRSVADPQAEKAFVLLLQAMAKKKVACLFRASLKGPARYAALTPDGHVNFLYYDGEVRAEIEWPDVSITKEEATQGLALIDSIGVTTPELVDERGEALLAYLAKKVKGGKGLAPKATADTSAPVLDLTSALEASIVAATKPKARPKKAAAKRTAA